MRRGLSLVEVLVVVVIIALLAGLTLPALTAARQASKQTSCTSNLRQLGMALSMYVEEVGTWPQRRALDCFEHSPSVQSILVCPSDGTRAFASKHMECIGQPSVVQTSYYSPFSKNPFLWQQLEEADANHGVAACRCHGSVRNVASAQGGFCHQAPFYYHKKVLTLRKDGSVKVRIVPDLTVGGNPRFSMWQLFTDVPVPYGP